MRVCRRNGWRGSEEARAEPAVSVGPEKRERGPERSDCGRGRRAALNRQAIGPVREAASTHVGAVQPLVWGSATKSVERIGPGRRIQEGVDAMGEHILKTRKGSELNRQLPELVRAGHVRKEKVEAQKNGCSLRHACARRPNMSGGPGQRPGVRIQVRREGVRGQHERICRSLRALIHDLGRDNVAFARDGFAERAYVVRST